MSRPEQRPAGCLRMLIALAASSAAVALIVVGQIGMAGFSGRLPLLPWAWLFVMVIAGILGMPLYMTATVVGRANWRTATLGGAAVAAIVPVLFGGLSEMLRGEPHVYLSTLAFGALGALAGLIFWLIVRGATIPMEDAAPSAPSPAPAAPRP